MLLDMVPESSGVTSSTREKLYLEDRPCSLTTILNSFQAYVGDRAARDKNTLYAWFKKAIYYTYGVLRYGPRES